MEEAKSLRILLGAARELIRRGWVQEHSATNVHGTVVDPYAEDATAWCLGGALMVAKRTNRDVVDLPTYKAILARIERACGVHADKPIPTWNDQQGRTQQEVLDLLDRLIQESENATHPSR